MKRSEVPSESLDLEFIPGAFEDPEMVKKEIVTCLRFIEKRLMPEIDEMMERIPGIHDMRERPLRTSEDCNSLLVLKSDVEAFMDKMELDLNRYLDEAVRSMSTADAGRVRDLLQCRLKSRMTSMELVALAAAQRMDGIFKAVEGILDPDNEESEEGGAEVAARMQRAVRDAGVRSRLPVDRMMR